MEIRSYRQDDIAEMVGIWNEVVRDGIAFPQEEELDLVSGSTSSHRRRTAASPRRTGASSGSTSCIPTTSGAAGTSPTPAMRSVRPRAARAQAVYSSKTRLPRARRTAFACCSSTLSSRPTPARATSTRSSASCSSAPFPVAFACPMARMSTFVPTTTSCRADETVIARGGSGA